MTLHILYGKDNICSGQDMLLKTSNIIGTNPGDGINLSNNSGISECPLLLQSLQESE
jgi:hypothetical protein